VSDQLRIHRVLDRTEAEGPGVRAAVWVQGCTIRCPGCFNPHTWARRGGTMVDAVELGERLAALPDIEGVTLLGGEPFEQAPALAVVASIVREAGRSVMTFSGTYLEQLHERATAGEPGVAALLDATDLLADGPYLQDQLDLSRPWIGSSNQHLRALTPRYASLVDELEARRVPPAERNRVEVRLAPDGSVFVNGMATTVELAELRRSLRR
jgi:anaerobic ribonucleoside-triphosphate reductase activating protein